ncbi:MAG: hypothetical protein ABIC82_04140 [bacterium]
MFDIVIDFDYWYKLQKLNNPILIVWQVIKDGGWIVFVFLFFYMLWMIWYNWRRVMAAKDWKYTFLAIDIPKNNEQSPKAVEYIFSQLAAVYSKGNLVDRYWRVKGQESFSFEIVSDGGYLQFYIWTNSSFRDLAEAAIYAQYPDAIITEVEDYTKGFEKQRFPNEKYEMYGTEMKFTNQDVYPIRTYPMFEHALSQELKDPMAGMLEILTRAKPGEMFWMQLVLTPIDNSWTNAGKNIIKKITGQGNNGSKNIIDKISDLPLKLITLIDQAIFPGDASGVSSSDKDEFSLQKLTPGEVDALKAVENKISKIGFKTNFRIVYLAPKELFDKKRIISGFLGSLQQFSILGMNSLKPNSKQTTNVDYFFTKNREAKIKNRILSKYISRSGDGSKIILNIEELATIYHFPVMTVKVPLLSKTGSKRSEPPFDLPAFVQESLEEQAEKEEAEKKDEFISLLEEMSSKNSEPSDGDIGVPYDFLEKENIEKARPQKERNGVPSNLPIAG